MAKTGLAKSASSEGEVEHTEETPVPPPVSLNFRRLDTTEGLRSLDDVDLEEIFERRAAVLRTVPKFLQGVSEAQKRFEGCIRRRSSRWRIQRAWKLLLLLPHTLPQTSTRRFGPQGRIWRMFCSFRSGKVGRIVPRQSQSRRASQCADGAKTQEGIHRQFLKASSESSFFCPEGGVVSSQASIGGSSVGSWNSGHSGSPHQPRQKTFSTSNLWDEGSRNTSLSNVSSWTRNFSSTSGQRGGVQQLVHQA